ncbi:MAG: methyltransferase [Vicinamibacterales bacterium]
MKAAYMACGGWVASAVGAAARFRLADLVEAGPMTAAELALAAGVSQPVLERLLALLVAVGLFAEADGRYSTTDDGALLREDHPDTVRNFVMLASGDYQRIFQEAAHTVETGESAAVRALGQTLYAHLDQHPVQAEIYDRAMEDLTRPASRVLSKSRDFSTMRTVVDLGGGRGALLRGLLRAEPHLQGIVLDRPDVAERARAALPDLAPDLVGRLEFVGGSFFDGVPPGGDLYIIKNVIHSWSDARAVDILRAAGAAIAGRPAARVLVIEPLVGGRMPPMYRALDELMQMVVSETGTTARTEDEFRALASGAGLTVTRVDQLQSGHVGIEMGQG